MTITIDWQSRIVDSDSSILDIVAFKDQIRDREDDADGVLYPPIITYKKVDIGGGAFFHAVDFINGYQLRFPTAGSYEVIGNINAPVVSVPGVFVKQTKAVAFATSSTGGGGGATPAQIWQHVIESTFTAEQVMRLLASLAAGQTVGHATGPAFKSLDGTKNRITADVDEFGNRSNVQIDAT